MLTFFGLYALIAGVMSAVMALVFTAFTTFVLKERVKVYTEVHSRSRYERTVSHEPDVRASVKFMLVAAAYAFVLGYLTFGFVNYLCFFAVTGAFGGAIPFILVSGFTAMEGIWLTRIFSAKRVDAKEAADMSIFVTAVTVFVLFAVIINGVSYLITNGPSGKKALAQLPQIVEHSQTDAIPQTDEKHLVLVSQAIAYNKGTQAIGDDGKNLGSMYQTNKDEYTLQSIAGHLYYVAPLDYSNFWNQFGEYTTPGYIKVDAENPNADATLVDNKPIHFTPRAHFGTNLQRHVYESGYTKCNLIDATLEIDDDGNPWYSISCAVPQQLYFGDVVQSVLLVNPDTGAVTSYKVGDVPAWVDRVYDSKTITDYMTWWGLYSKAGWPNFSGAGQMKPVDDSPMILYSKVNQEPVFIQPMTSSNDNDQSSTGLMLCQTRSNHCDFYPIYGYPVGSTVEDAFQNAPGNIKKYAHENTQLVDLFGRLTWVATYYSGDGDIHSYVAVGLVDATKGKMQPSNVIVATGISDALTEYQAYLAANPANGTQPTSASTKVTFPATVAAVTSTVQNGSTVYLLLFKGEQHIFRLTTATYPYAPFIKVGDVVTVTYLATNQLQVPVDAFSDTTITNALGG